MSHVIWGMARRKRNPGFGTLVGLGLLAVGGYVVYDTFIKKPTKDGGKTSGSTWPPKVVPNHPYAVGSDCERILREPTEADEAKGQQILFSTLKSLGGHVRIDPNNPDGLEFDLLDVIGPPPGDPVDNVQFVQAWATAIFKRTVHPNCLKKIPGLSENYAKEANAFGADFTEYPDGSQMPGATLQYLRELVQVLSILMQLFGGYEMGIDLNAQPAMAAPGLAIF